MIIAKSARRPWWGAAIAVFVIAVVVYMSTKRPSTLRPINYSVSLASSRDYWNYALAILPAANAGNADAQFYLWKVIDFCGHPYNRWFEDASKPGRLMTLDDAMQEAASQNAALDIVQVMWDRCHRLRELDSGILGNKMDWLSQATKAGQPIAQATTARLRMLQDQAKQLVNAGATSTQKTAQPPIAGALDPRQLLRDAVASKDPAVLYEIASVQALLHRTDSRAQNGINYVAWLYVACQRGLDCSSNADWVRLSCNPRISNCEGGTATLMNMAGDNWPAVEQRAQEINTLLDAGRWDELGIGAGTG